MPFNMRIVCLTVLLSTAGCWVPKHSVHRRDRSRTCLDAAVGIFFGTSTGSTQTVAEAIYEAFGDGVASEPIDVDTLNKDQLAQTFGEHDALIVGTPTWNTGADTERSGTGWDELYYQRLPELKNVLAGKKVAVFGLGDQVSYAENYADATGELFDVFEGLGCQMLGSWPTDGYEHEASKAVRGDKFCGLLLDMVNQEDLTGERVQQWVQQLKSEGLLKGSVAASGEANLPAAAAPATAVVTLGSIAGIDSVNGATPGSRAVDLDARIAELERENALLRKQVEAYKMSAGVESDSSLASARNFDPLIPTGFTPHYNPITGKTMWTSPDGRKAYVTTEKAVAG